MKSIRMFLSIALLSGWAHTVLAAPPGHASASTATPNRIKFQAVGFYEKTTTDKSGVKHTTMVPVDHVLPGTDVRWDLNYEVIGNDPRPVTDTAITDPIPANMTYVAGSATGQGADITFSVDGGKTWGKPEQLQVKDADGTLRAATAKDYTDIRWFLKGPFAAGAKGTVSFHATLN